MCACNGHAGKSFCEMQTYVYHICVLRGGWPQMCPRPPSWFHAKHRALKAILMIDMMPEKEWLAACPQLSLHDQQCQFREANIELSQHRTITDIAFEKFTMFEFDRT